MPVPCFARGKERKRRNALLTTHTQQTPSPFFFSPQVFIPGGFAFKHANNTMDISAPEAVKLEDIDVDALRAANSEAAKRLAAAGAGTRDAAEARAALEVYSALGKTLKVTL
jgi:hypothetical protein